MHPRFAIWIVLLLALGCDKGAAGPAAGQGNVAQAPGRDHADRQALQARLQKLLAERVQAAQRAAEAYRAAYEADTVTHDMVVWANDALWTAELAQADTDAKRDAAHINHIRRQAWLLNQVEPLYKEGARGGEATKYAASQYALETAEIALVDDCLASGREYPTFEIYPGAAPAEPAKP